MIENALFYMSGFLAGALCCAVWLWHELATGKRLVRPIGHTPPPQETDQP